MIPRPYFAATLLAAALAVSQTVGHAQSGPSSGYRSGPAAAAAAAPEYRIGPEDVLDIVVWKDIDLTSRGVQVRPDGRISLPLVNDILAAGLTPMELRDAITKKLDAFDKGKDVSVTVRDVNSMRISVMGAVRTPNRYPLRSQLTVLDALAMAGGLTEFADKDKISVLRLDGTRLIFNYSKFVKEPNPTDNFVLRTGDIVFIP
jgi:polysaccharide export outer membrane protein